MITAEDLAQRLAGLDGIGMNDGARGVTRLPWTHEDALSGEWFAAQAAELGLRVERDGAGNRWALPAGDGPWWGIGSHLDSVREGGRFDGPLGVAAAFAVAATCPRPLAVISFADEEGARFNTPTFGSRALTRRLDIDDVLARTDADGVTMAEAMRASGVDPNGLRTAPAQLARLRGFLELHIDQSRDVALAGVPFAVATGLAARLRLALTFDGTADHAGTTPMDDRQDAMAACARLITAALDAASDAIRVTATRILLAPGALSTIPSEVRLWLDVRASDEPQLAAFETVLAAQRAEIAARTGVRVTARTDSRSPGCTFDRALRRTLRQGDGAVPEVTCFAGHDAGNLATAVPSAMVLIRNRTGVSHSPDERVSLDDAAAGSDALRRALLTLAG